MKLINLVLFGVLMFFVLAGCNKTENAEIIENEEVVETLSWQEQYDLGMKYLSEGNYEEAIIAFTVAIELEPKQSALYLGLAEVYIAQNDFDSAMDIIKARLEQNPDDADLQARLEELKSGNISDYFGNVRQMSTYDESGELVWYHIYDFVDGKKSMAYYYDEEGNKTSSEEYDSDDNLIRTTIYN